MMVAWCAQKGDARNVQQCARSNNMWCVREAGNGSLITHTILPQTNVYICVLCLVCFCCKCVRNDGGNVRDGVDEFYAGTIKEDVAKWYAVEVCARKAINSDEEWQCMCDWTLSENVRVRESVVRETWCERRPLRKRSEEDGDDVNRKSERSRWW